MRGKHSRFLAIACSQQTLLLLLAALPACAQLDDQAPVPSIKDQLEGRVEDSSGKTSNQTWKIEENDNGSYSGSYSASRPVSAPTSNSGDYLKGSLSTTDTWFQGSANNNMLKAGSANYASNPLRSGASNFASDPFRANASNYPGNLQAGVAGFDSSGFLRGNVNTFNSGASTNFLRGQTSTTTLQGRIQDYDKGLHLLRPMSGDDPLNRSVRVLSGQQPLQGTSQDETFDQALSANNFVLTKQAPQTAPRWASPNMSVDQSLSRITMSPNFAWSIKGWWVDDWGPGLGGRRNRRYYQQSNFALDWSPYFDPNSLRVDPSMYSQVSYPRTNIGWSVPPAQQMTPPVVTPVYTEQNITWDQWYQNVSAAMYRNWNRGEQPGDATLRLTATRGRRIEAQILKCNNPNASFKQSLIAAVNSLNKSPILDFPAGSQKQVVTFDSAFSAGINTKAGAGSDRHGEIETITRRLR
jgi:hypothetical protein